MIDRARRAIWLVDADSGAQSPLVAGPGSHTTPRWSPKGDRLAYVSTAEGDKPQLYVRWMATGATARVATLTDAPGDLSWSPDGRYLAFSMFEPAEGPKLGSAPPKPEGAKWAEPLEVITDVTYRADGDGYLKPGFTHIYVVSADGGAPRRLTWGDYDDGGPLSWSRTGRHRASGNREPGWQREPMNPRSTAVRADGTVRS